MAVILQFQRENHNTPWGFRLTGGTDYDFPLTVIKVTDGSIAENVGMKVGDLLVRVGDTATAGLAHLQAHDLIKNAGDCFEVAVIRGELPESYTETTQTFDSETTENGISQSLQINIKTNVVDKTEIIVETGEVIQQNIKINGSFVNEQKEENVDITINTEEEKVLKTEEIAEEVEAVAEEKDALSEKLEKLMETPENIKQSEVMKVIKEETKTETKEELMKRDEKRWTTFLQKPKRPKPKIKQKEIEEASKIETTLSEEGRDEHFLFTRLLSVVQEPPYRVIIQKQKKKRDEEKEKAKEISSQQSTPIPEEMQAPTPEISSEQEELRERQEEMERQQQQQQQEEEEMRNEESEVQTEDYELTDDPMISEVEMSLEDQLAAIQRQLLALTQLPAAIQQTLDAVTQQLTKIVGPVNDPNTEEKELEDEERRLNSPCEDTDKEDKTDALETLEEVSESGLESQYADQDVSQSQSQQSLEGNKTEAEVEAELEMLQATPEPPDELLTPEEREARRLVDKKHKEQEAIMQDLRSRRVKDRPNYPQTPLPRPICLPGGKKWHAPDDAHQSALHRHKDMSDDLIAETISCQSEILTGTTLGYEKVLVLWEFRYGSFQIAHWNDIWPWGDHLGRKIYRDANTHLVPSKAEHSQKINFLKFQPPPKTLDHLKNSEVYKMIHEMDGQPLRGVGAREGKSMAEEDYYSQAHQEGQMKG